MTQPPEPQNPANQPATPPASANVPPPAAPQAGYQAPQPSAPVAPGYAASAPAPYAVQPQPQIGIPASFGQRVVAYLIDGIISFLPFLIALPVFFVLLAQGARDTTVDPTTGALSPGSGAAIGGGVAVILLGSLVSLAISIWNRGWRAGTKGQSIGRKTMGLVLIRKTDGAVIGFWLAIGREVASSVINQAFYIADLWMLWDDEQQTLQDKIVSSRVVTLESLPGWTPKRATPPQ